MIFSEVRAQAWKYATYALAVLAVAAIIAAVIFRGNAAGARLTARNAEQERDQARAEVVSLKAANDRDAKAEVLTTTARQTVDESTAVSDQRAAQIKVTYRDRIVEVPAVCPVPDPGLMQELAQQAARISAAEGGLRGAGRAP